MATSNYLRKMKRYEAASESKKKSYSKMSFAEKSKAAWAILNSGEAEDMKQAWAILKKNH